MALEGMGSGGGTTLARGGLPLTQPNPLAKNTAARPVYRQPVMQAATTSSSPIPSTNTGGGAGGSFGGGIAAPQTMAPAGVSEADFLATDPGYTAQLKALLRALSDNGTDVTAQQSKYNVDYGDAVKNLGYIQDDPTTPDVNEGAWNFNDLNTAAGRSFNNQQNDFAGRGLLQSSLYGTAQDNLTRSLNDQLGGINTAKSSFMDDLARQQGAFNNQNTLSQQQAKADALQRRSAGISI